ncbi:hypothetical protein OAL43_01975 [bacterium]|nr:hypothetical protein [bacterium]
MSTSVLVDELKEERDRSRDDLRKSRFSGCLFAAFILTFFALVNLPFQVVEVEGEWVGYVDLSDSQQASDTGMPVMGGWPLRYSVAYSSKGEVTYRYWQPLNLLINIVLGLVLSWLMTRFLMFRHQSLAVAEESNRKRRFFDIVFAACIVVVPIAIFAAKVRRPYQQQRLAKQLRRNGNLFVSAWIPAILEPHLPQGIKRSLREIRHVRFLGIDDRLLDQAVEIPTLVSLHSFDGQHSVGSLQKLQERLHFDSLMLSGCDVGDEEIDAIVALPWLQHLKFPQTKLTVAQLRRLDSKPLRTVDLTGTSIDLDQLGEPDWVQTCELLWLSRPLDGDQASLNLDGWPVLEGLWVKRRSHMMNDAVLGLRLANLPSLKRLSLDRVQKHDLSLINLPRLVRIEEELIDARFVVNDNYLLPGLTWVRKLEVDGVDSLVELGCYAKDLEELNLGSVPSLKKFKLGAYLITLLGNVVPDTAQKELCGEWIQYLGQQQGPVELDFAYLPLEGVNLAPLANNKKIKRLNLNGTHASFDQLRQLAPMSEVDFLDARTTPLNKNGLRDLLNQFPDLANLAIDGTRVSDFDLVGRDRLKFVNVSAMHELESLRLIDQPRIKTSLQVTSTLNELSILNIPRLNGLSVEGPWPESAELKGLRDLEWFAGGGVEVTDAVAEEVLECQHLHRLAFAYSSLTKSSLRKIGDLGELVSLALPGSVIDDSIVREWRNVDDLWEVNLDDAPISAGTIAWLTRMSSLRRVSLNRISLDGATVNAISELRQVNELHLAESQLPIEALSVLLQQGHLQVLNLSGWDLTEEYLQVFERDGGGLQHLILGSDEVSAETYHRLMAISDSVFVELDSIPEFLDDAGVELLHQRADDVRRQVNSDWRLMLQSPQDEKSTFTPDTFWIERQRRIDERLIPLVPRSFLVSLNRNKFSHGKSVHD